MQTKGGNIYQVASGGEFLFFVTCSQKDETRKSSFL